MAATVKKKSAPPAKESPELFNDLVASNIASLTQGLANSTEAVELLTRKVTGMACHIVALEALLTEVIAVTGVDLVRVNGRIRSRIANQAETATDSEVVVDLAAAIASQVSR